MVACLLILSFQPLENNLSSANQPGARLLPTDGPFRASAMQKRIFLKPNFVHYRNVSLLFHRVTFIHFLLPVCISILSPVTHRLLPRHKSKTGGATHLEKNDERQTAAYNGNEVLTKDHSTYDNLGNNPRLYKTYYFLAPHQKKVLAIW